MTSADDQMREIEQLEQWFGQVCQDVSGLDTTRIKERVAIAVDEQWLDGQLHDDPRADLADRAKRRIWAELAAGDETLPHEARGKELPRSLRRPYAWIGAAAAVAACVTAFVGLQRTQSNDVELCYVSAFEQFEADDFVDSVASLETDLDDLETAFEEVNDSEEDNTSYDELLDAIEMLMTNDEPVDDWS
jgi:hypothetical protein